MVDPRFIPCHNPIKKDIAILKLSGHLSCSQFPASKNVVDDPLIKVDDMIKANRRVTIDGVEEELGIGHE
ncbi:hypothetical protein TNCV_3271691 [Trichonephila clavipes]|nr:hypothetical protein TNCV_3271691 [Trichonephila clavipes]